MNFNLEHAIDLLRRTPEVLRLTLSGLSSEWQDCNDGDGTWSPYDVLGHLIHAELTDWIPRARMIIEEGPLRTFEPFDRYAQFEESTGKSLAELLTTFEKLRRESLESLKGMKLSPGDLEREGSHPEFGRVTMSQLLATWVVHDQGHLVQIHRTMARQYREAIGPWKAYLSVIN